MHDREASDAKARHRRWILAAVVSLLVASFSVAFCTMTNGRDALGEERADGAMSVTDEGDGFPTIDWGYWMSVNPDIVGWITVPGTAIDQPIVRASADDPDFYLSHAIDKASDPKGCAFLDAECADGLDSLNCTIYGHNWSDGSMFADFSMYGESAFAYAHQSLLLQSPEFKRKLDVLCVDVVQGSERSNVLSFEGRSEFECWLQSRYSDSVLQLAPPPTGDAAPERVYTFCTCSYNRWDNERTLVYAT